MASEVSLSSLIAAVSKEAILSKLLTIASALGLSTESWQPGDPTRTLFAALSQMDEDREVLVIDLVKSGFLDLASGIGLTLLARYLFLVERRTATYATSTIRLTNGSGAFHNFDAEDLTFRNSATGKTFRNTTGGTLASGIGQTLDLEIKAEEGGSDSTSAVGEIDELVYAVANVSAVNTTAAVGTDEESDPDLRERCRAKLQSISVAGPRGGYHYAAVTPELNGGAAVTKTREVPDSDVGHVDVYLAGPAGAVSSDDRDLVEEAIETWATPLCIDVTVASAENFVQAVTYTLWLYDTAAETTAQIEEKIEDALLEAFKTRPIGGDVISPDPTGFIYKDWIEAQIIRAVSPHGFKVTVSTPAADVALNINQVASLGAVTATINWVAP